MFAFWRGLGTGIVLTAVLLGGFAYMFRGVLPRMLNIPTPTLPPDVVTEVTASTAEVHAKIRQELPFSNQQDFAFAARGFIATRDDPLLKDENGKIVFNLAAYDFLQGEAPESVHPSLWRQAQLVTQHGLYKVSAGIYQVRGFDISNVTFLIGDHGYIVVDPLSTIEAARAAYELLQQHVGNKPVSAVVYSHSHVDHFGGVGGMVSEHDVQAGRVQIIAPVGFLEHAVSENVLTGPVMARRSRLQFGTTLRSGPKGEITSGLGPGISKGTISLIAPTMSIMQTGQEITVDGVTMVFQLTPGTEAPAEMNFYLPQMRALFVAENANSTMHNLLPARGALVRDAKAWADYLTQTTRLYAAKSDVLFAAHGIPRWDSTVITDYLRKHRDTYKFLHDQTVRLMNNGLTALEIAEQLQLPEALAQEWYNRGYYGTLSHNAKAVYQRYMGWYDANPASLQALPPVAAGRHYVAALGGAEAVMSKASEAMQRGEYRWAAMLLNHLVFADSENVKAKTLLADVYIQLGYRAEAGTWRNIYLTGAQELQHGVLALPPRRLSPALMRATPTSVLLDFAAARLHPERAQNKKLVLNVVLSDCHETYLLTVEHSVLIHEEGIHDEQADATVTMQRADLLETLLAGVPLAVKMATGAIKVQGKSTAYRELISMIDPVDANFNIVTP